MSDLLKGQAVCFMVGGVTVINNSLNKIIFFETK